MLRLGGIRHLSVGSYSSFALTAGAGPGYISPPAPHATGVPALLVLPCAAGTFTTTATATACVPCAPGKYNGAPAARSEGACVRCNGFTSTPGAGSTSASECTVCPAAMESDGTAAGCACERGRYGTPDVGSDCPECACKRCASKFYQNETGAIACKKCGTCANGATKSSCGESFGGFCIPCAPGKFVNQEKCDECEPGSFSNATNLAACFACGADGFQASAGQGFCSKHTVCAAGERVIAPIPSTIASA